jgi:hypothetical protein
VDVEVANSPNSIQKSVSLADFLATVVSDGDESDIVFVTKTDAPGQEAAASDIAEHAGCLWSNRVDDAFLRTYNLYYKSTKLWIAADSAERDAFGSADDLSENDLCFVVNTTLVFYCVSVDGVAASTWSSIAATGSVAGPGASTDLAIARWDGAGGGTLQNSVVIVSDLGALSGITDITLSGNVDGRNVSADGTTLDAHVASIANPHTTLLSQVLDAGNDTDGFHILVTNGDEINGQDGGYVRFAAGTGLVETSDLSVIGKLTVSGLIDPTGLVLDEQAASPFTAAGKHTIWAKNTIPSTLWTTDDAGNETQVATGTTLGLSAVLTVGNTSGANDVIIDSGQKIQGEDGVATVGGDLTLEGGAGDGDSGGSVYITGGPAGDGGGGGSITISGAAGGTTSGAGGTVSIAGGAASDGNSDGGSVLIVSGQPNAAGNPGDVTITATAASTGNVVGGVVTVEAGDGAGTQAGGSIMGTAGSGDAIGTGAGGMVSWAGGAGGGTSGVGGAAYIAGGNGTAGNSAGGEAGAIGGNGQGSAAGGTARIQGGDGGATGAGGVARIKGGAGGSAGGVAEVIGGAGSAATATGGAATLTAGAGGSGAATGGAVSITSGAGGATSGNSGAVNIASGAITSGTRGTITLDAPTIVFTATTDVTVTNHSYHSVRGSTARGAVNTQIYRWTGVVDSTGTDITYTDSANSGGSWAINTAGLYSVSCSIDVGHNGYIAIKRAAALSNTFDETSIVAAVEAITGNTVAASWTGWCASGDDIWIATSAATNPTGTPINNNRVTVARVR